MLAQFGGSWSNGANAGVSYWNLNNSSSNANSNNGARLLISIFNVFSILCSLPLGKNSADKEQGLVGSCISKRLEANKKVACLEKRFAMKRVGYIYPQICNMDNIRQAIWHSSRGKRNQRRVRRILGDIDFYAVQISHILVTKTYIPSPYSIKTIQDGATKKVRMIYKPRYYPDQIIHWALIQQIEPIIMRGMYEYSCGSIPGRGTSYARKALRRWLDSDFKHTKYCLKMDITKFYPSIDNELLKALFRRKIKDTDCLWLIDAIIDTCVGLPIGNYTSQWFANFYLEGLDHFIKQELGVKYYIRYVDDLVLLGGNKKELHAARRAIADYLSSLGLRIRDDWQVFKVDCRAIDVLGYRFFRDKTTLRKRNALRIRRRCKKIISKPQLTYRDACAVISYWGWLKHSDSYNFYYRYVRPAVSLLEAKKVVSDYAKVRNYSRW